MSEGKEESSKTAVEIKQPPQGPGLFLYSVPKNVVKYEHVEPMFDALPGFRELTSHSIFGNTVFFIGFDTLGHTIAAVDAVPHGRKIIDGLQQPVSFFYQMRQ